MGYADDQSFYTGILHKSGCTSTYIISSPYYGNISPDYLQYPWPETSETNSPTPSAFVSARKAVVLRIALAIRHAPAHQLQVATRFQGVAQVVVPRVAGDEDHFLTEASPGHGQGPRESPGVCCYIDLHSPWMLPQSPHRSFLGCNPGSIPTGPWPSDNTLHRLIAFRIHHLSSHLMISQGTSLLRDRILGAPREANTGGGVSWPLNSSHDHRFLSKKVSSGIVRKHERAKCHGIVAFPIIFPELAIYIT